MNLSKQLIFVLGVCVLGIMILLGFILGFEDNKITTFDDLIIKNIDEEIKNIRISKQISPETFELIDLILEDQQEIEFFMKSVSDMQLEKKNSVIPSIVDIAYHLYIRGEEQTLYGIIISKYGLMLIHDYGTSEDAVYQINNFDLDLFQSYFE